MNYEGEVDRALGYFHEALQKAIIINRNERIKRATPPGSRYAKGTEYDFHDTTPSLVYADYLEEQNHPAEHVIRWWADHKRREAGDRVGMKGMFVGHSNEPEDGSGIGWAVGESRKVKLYPEYPIWVSTNYGHDGHYDRHYAPITPSEAYELADKIDAHYDGKHPIASDLRSLADKYSKRKKSR